MYVVLTFYIYNPGPFSGFASLVLLRNTQTKIKKVVTHFYFFVLAIFQLIFDISNQENFSLLVR